MPERRLLPAGAAMLFGMLALANAPAQVTLSEGTNFSVDVSGDGRLAIDLLGNIWVMPLTGGQAVPLTETTAPARMPRWSPDNRQILFSTQAAEGAALHLLDVEEKTLRPLSDAGFPDHFAGWHPDGKRIVFSSARHQGGLDIWEHDLPTGLSWRLTDMPGDESYPVWSSNGRHLAYIHVRDGTWSLMLRRFAQADEMLLESDQPLSSLTWRPDGSLLTFFRHEDRMLTLHMLILSDPPLLRRLAHGEDFFGFPISWQGRQQFFYTADGVVKTRSLGGRRGERVHFTAAVSRPTTRSYQATASHRLPVTTPPENALVIRGRRLFDGISDGYREAVDILIEGGVIASVAPRRDWPGVTVLDLGDVSILPGFIDAYSALPQGDPGSSGAALLSYGITSIVSDDPVPGAVGGGAWESEQTPGPRLLEATAVADSPVADSSVVLATVVSAGNGAEAQIDRVRAWQEVGVPVLADSWNVGLSVGADLLLGAHVLPSSPLRRRYQDVRLAVQAGPIALLSGLADAATPGLDALFESRQARLYGHVVPVSRRFAATPLLAARSARIVLGSKPNGLPPGLALHAELRALAAAGLSGDQVLRAAGANAASMLGLETQLGQVAAGALADLVLVAGDPLNEVADSLKIVAIVRNGRFFSLINLLERASGGMDVE